MNLVVKWLKLAVLFGRGREFEPRSGQPGIAGVKWQWENYLPWIELEFNSAIDLP